MADGKRKDAWDHTALLAAIFSGKRVCDFHPFLRTAATKAPVKLGPKESVRHLASVFERLGPVQRKEGSDERQFDSGRSGVHRDDAPR